MKRYFSFFLSTMLVSLSLGADETESCDFVETVPMFYDGCWPIGVDLSVAFDDFRGIYSGSFMNSYGAVFAANFTYPIGCSFGAQLGGSYGVYEWSGRSSTPFKNSKTVQQQGFITVAATWQTACSSGINAGLAYDWMLNKNFGLFAVNPFFDQIRGQIGYLFCCRNELGIWATYGIQESHKSSQNIPLKFRGISQVNLFWCHYFDNDGYGMLWIGTPYRKGLLYRSGRPGELIIGAQIAVPITCNLSLEGHASYMFPRHWSGVFQSRNYGANIYLGLTYSFGYRRVTKSPYMTIGNNSNFMADTNQNF